MGTLLKVIMVGNERVGKTCLMNRLVSKKMNTTYKATIGVDFMSKDITVDGVEAVIQIWDTAGQERYQSLGTSFYRGAEGCVLVFDVTNPSSFESLEKLRNDFITNSEFN